jgi:hypothetical protein
MVRVLNVSDPEWRVQTIGKSLMIDKWLKKKEEACFSEIMAFTYKSRRRYNPEDEQQRHFHGHENFKILLVNPVYNPHYSPYSCSNKLQLLFINVF